MKILRTNWLTVLMTISLGIGTLSFSGCDSTDEAGPCDDLECLNGGEKITGADGCLCDCPPAFSGANCETAVSECPPSAECPIGYSPNPDNDCACEKI